MSKVLIPKELEEDQGYLQSVCTQMIIDNLTGTHKEFHKGVARVMYLISIFASVPEDESIDIIKEVLDDFNISYKIESMSTIEKVIDSTVNTLINIEPNTVELDTSEEGARTDISSLEILSTMAKYRNCIDTMGDNMGEILMSTRNGIDDLLWDAISKAVKGVNKDMALGIEREVKDGDEIYRLIYEKADKRDLHETMSLEDLIS